MSAGEFDLDPLFGVEGVDDVRDQVVLLRCRRVPLWNPALHFRLTELRVVTAPRIRTDVDDAADAHTPQRISTKASCFSVPCPTVYSASDIEFCAFGETIDQEMKVQHAGERC
jgi:hypothetical protein